MVAGLRRQWVPMDPSDISFSSLLCFVTFYSSLFRIFFFYLRFTLSVLWYIKCVLESNLVEYQVENKHILNQDGFYILTRC